MKPRLKILTAFSALLFALTLGLGARSYHVTDVLECRDLIKNDTSARTPRNVSQVERQRAILSARGTITWAEGRHLPLRRDSRIFNRWIFTDGDAMYLNTYRRQNTLSYRLGFDYYNEQPPILRAVSLTWTPSFLIAIPYWLPALCFAIAPTIHLLRRLRVWLNERRAGLCPECGYDLRATPERCPECGATPPTPTVTARTSPL